MGGISFMPGMGWPEVIRATISANVGGYGAVFCSGWVEGKEVGGRSDSWCGG